MRSVDCRVATRQSGHPAVGAYLQVRPQRADRHEGPSLRIRRRCQVHPKNVIAGIIAHLYYLKRGVSGWLRTTCASNCNLKNFAERGVATPPPIRSKIAGRYGMKTWLQCRRSFCRHEVCRRIVSRDINWYYSHSYGLIRGIPFKVKEIGLTLMGGADDA